MNATTQYANAARDVALPPSTMMGDVVHRALERLTRCHEIAETLETKLAGSRPKEVGVEGKSAHIPSISENVNALDYHLSLLVELLDAINQGL